MKDLAAELKQASADKDDVSSGRTHTTPGHHVDHPPEMPAPKPDTIFPWSRQTPTQGYVSE